jgi:hypothetical protein
MDILAAIKREERKLVKEQAKSIQPILGRTTAWRRLTAAVENHEMDHRLKVGRCTRSVGGTVSSALPALRQAGSPPAITNVLNPCCRNRCATLALVASLNTQLDMKSGERAGPRGWWWPQSCQRRRVATWSRRHLKMSLNSRGRLRYLADDFLKAKERQIKSDCLSLHSESVRISSLPLSRDAAQLGDHSRRVWRHRQRF